VKRRSADGSVGPPHARVGNCQASNKKPLSTAEGFLLYEFYKPSLVYQKNKPRSPPLLCAHPFAEKL
ncbi:hypothetical protein ROM12_20690, partial [Cronobacter sakazakii]